MKSIHCTDGRDCVSLLLVFYETKPLRFVPLIQNQSAFIHLSKAMKGVVNIVHTGPEVEIRDRDREGHEVSDDGKYTSPPRTEKADVLSGVIRSSFPDFLNWVHEFGVGFICLTISNHRSLRKPGKCAALTDPSQCSWDCGDTAH
jgi:hypothetical protein